MNRYCLGGVALVVNLFLVSSALGQVKLPPEEIGFINQRVIAEIAPWAPSTMSKGINLAFVQYQLVQDAENKCSNLEEFKEPNYDSKAIIQGRLARSKSAGNSQTKIDHLICGIEEFVLYNASQNNLLTRRTLNRARQMVINIGKIEEGSSQTLKIDILTGAYELALKQFKTDVDALRMQAEPFDYLQNGLEFRNMVTRILPNFDSSRVKVIVLENLMAWLASDIIASNNVTRSDNAHVALSLLQSLSANIDLLPGQRAQLLSEGLVKAFEPLANKKWVEFSFPIEVFGIKKEDSFGRFGNWQPFDPVYGQKYAETILTAVGFQNEEPVADQPKAEENRKQFNEFSENCVRDRDGCWHYIANNSYIKFGKESVAIKFEFGKKR